MYTYTATLDSTLTLLRFTIVRFKQQWKETQDTTTPKSVPNSLKIGMEVFVHFAQTP